MFDKTYVGPGVLGEFAAPEALQSWSRVIIQVDDDLSYTAGTETGRTLTVSIPYGTQQMAEDMLRRLRGKSYQPFRADASIVDPAAELGDAVEVRGVYGGIYKRERRFGRLYTANLAAPGDEEVDHEYPYKSAQARQITRQRKETKASLQVLADKIALEVSAREEGERQLLAAITVQADRITQEVTDRKNATEALSSQITQQAGQIAAKVSKTGGSPSSFGWDLLDSFMAWYSSGTEVVRFDSSGAKIRGRIEALSGKIGGLDIQKDHLSYNGQTWGGTNTWGCYIGSSGIQLGRNFKVDMAGNLEAASGRFTGEVYAGRIDYGGEAGHLWGEAISEGSVSGGWGGQIAGGSIGTFNTSGGINTSLGYADFANGVFNGWNEASEVNTGSLKLDGHYLNRASIKIGNSYHKLVTWI